MLSVENLLCLFLFLYATKEASHPALVSMQELTQRGSVSVGKVIV